MVTGISPVLLVSDLARSVAYHRDRLGFRCDVFGDPPDFATAKTRRGDDPARALRGAGTDRSQLADRRQDLERLHPRRRRRAHLREVQERGAAIDYTIYNAPSGFREFGVQDPGGHDIAFGQPLEPRS